MDICLESFSSINEAISGKKILQTVQNILHSFIEIISRFIKSIPKLFSKKSESDKKHGDAPAFDPNKMTAEQEATLKKMAKDQEDAEAIREKRIEIVRENAKQHLRMNPKYYASEFDHKGILSFIKRNLDKIKSLTFFDVPMNAIENFDAIKKLLFNTTGQMLSLVESINDTTGLNKENIEKIVEYINSGISGYNYLSASDLMENNFGEFGEEFLSTINALTISEWCDKSSRIQALTYDHLETLSIVHFAKCNIEMPAWVTELSKVENLQAIIKKIDKERKKIYNFDGDLDFAAFDDITELMRIFCRFTGKLATIICNGVANINKINYVSECEELHELCKEYVESNLEKFADRMVELNLAGKPWEVDY